MTSCKWKQSNWKGKRLLSTFILYIYTIQSSSGSQALPRGENVHFSLTTVQAESNDGTPQVMFKTSNFPKKRRHSCKYTSTYARTTAEIPSGALPLDQLLISLTIDSILTLQQAILQRYRLYYGIGFKGKMILYIYLFIYLLGNYLDRGDETLPNGNKTTNTYIYTYYMMQSPS